MRELLRAAVRSLRHRPGMAAAIVLTLTLGLGANSTIFSAVDAILLKPLPYPSSDRLVSVYEARFVGHQTNLVAPVRLEDWNGSNQTFDGLTGCFFENATDTTRALPERVGAMRTSPRFFPVFRVPAALGRTFTPEEERFGGPQVVVLSDAFWRQRYGTGVDPVGRSLMLGGVSRTIVGVMPPSFRYPTATTEVWMPAQYSPGLLQAREARFLFAVGRLKPGVTLERGRDDLSAVQSRLGLQFPRTDAGWSAAVVPLKEEQIGGVRRSLWLLLAAVTLVLVAACVNIACLLVAEASRREREIAVSLALGASRARIVSQLLVEGTLLATLGALASLLFSRWTIGLLRTGRFGAVGGVTLARLREVALDRRLLLFTIVAGVSTTVLFALAPALQATRKDVASRLGHASRTQSVGQQGLQRLLVTVQVALAIVLLAGAGLMVRSFSRLQHVSAGFDPSQVLAFRMSAQWTERPDAVTNRQLRTLARLSAVPGIVSSAFAQALPATVDYPPGEFKIVGRDTGEHLFGHARAVSADYFKTLRIPILQGETCRDDPTRLYANVLVTRGWADHFFPNESRG
jgi:putative ABC transport system permease protein